MSDLTYDYVDESISPSLECPICRCPLIDPLMPKACQHLFCSSCLERALDLSPTCPIDRMRIRNRREDLVPAPRVVGDLLAELKVRCTRCREEMPRDGWARHEAGCRSAVHPGEGSTLREGSGLDVGVESETGVESSSPCEICKEHVRTADLAAHVKACSALPRPCRYCDVSLPSTQHASHLLDTCPLVPTPCPHAAFGCAYVGPRDTLPGDHLYSDCPYEPLKDCFERFKEKEREWESENWRLRRQVEGLEQRLGDFEGHVESAKHSFGDYLVKSPDLESTQAEPLPPLPHALSSVSSRTASLSTSLSTLTQSHTESLHTTQHLVEELSNLRSVIGGMRMQMGDLLRTVQILSSTPRGPLVNAEGVGFGTRATIGRPGFASRQSDSSSDDHEVEPYSHGERDLSSSVSDPEDDLVLFSSASTSSRPMGGPLSRPLPHPMLHYPPPHRSHWATGYDYGPGGGDQRYWRDGGGPSLVNFSGAGGPLPPRPLFPGLRGGASARNGRVVGGIGSGMKL